MSIGDRIKRVRNFRKMTMKELGMAVGFDESSADVRIAQYESNDRRPKEELLRKIAQALDVNYMALAEPSTFLYSASDIIEILFELDNKTTLKLFEVIDKDEYPEERVAISTSYNILNMFLQEWRVRKQELANGEITEEEYQEWKLNWPDTMDDLGKTIPSKKWRNADKEKPSET